MQSIDLGEDTGLVEFRLAGASVVLDVWEVHNRVSDFHAKNKEAPAHDYNEGLAQIVESLGLGRVSHQMAHRFVVAVNKVVNDMEKKTQGALASPASTTSTPAA